MNRKPENWQESWDEMELKEIQYRDEVVSLYTSVGWHAYTSDLKRLEKGFESSLLKIGAFDNDQLIGLIRVVGDGQTVILIQDVLVHPDYQRQGIGSSLIKEVLQRYDHVRQIQLLTDRTPKTQAFYEALGFVELNEFACSGYLYQKNSFDADISSVNE